jgi:hypothetical protein
MRIWNLRRKVPAQAVQRGIAKIGIVEGHHLGKEEADRRLKKLQAELENTTTVVATFSIVGESRCPFVW